MMYSMQDYDNYEGVSTRNTTITIMNVNTTEYDYDNVKTTSQCINNLGLPEDVMVPAKLIVTCFDW